MPALSSSSKITIRVLYPLLLITIILVVFWVQVPNLFSKSMWPDEALFGWYAKQIAACPLMIFSKEINEFHPPLFAGLLALVHFFIPHESVYRFFSLLMSLLGIYLIYRIGEKLKDQFTGLYAAMNLAFNILYLGYSTRILIDNTLIVMVLFFAHSMLNLDASFKKQFMISLTGCLIILLKWPGILIIPFLIMYALLSPHPLHLKDKLKTIRTPLFAFSMVILYLLIGNYLILRHVLPDISALEGRYRIHPFWYYIMDLPVILTPLPFLVPFFIYGFFMNLRNPLLVSWLLVFLSGISSVPEKDLRYSLLVIPVIILISCLGLSALIETRFKSQKQQSVIKIITVIIIMVFYFALLPRTQKFLHKKSETFTGFQEAGEWIKKEGLPNAMVLASSARAIRYYSNIEFAKYGGQIRLLPALQSTFEDIVKHTQGPIFVEIDFWEKNIQPKWLYPISNTTQLYMASLGFKPALTIRQKIYSGNGPEQMMPVVWIFKRLKTLPDGKVASNTHIQY